MTQINTVSAVEIVALVDREMISDYDIRVRAELMKIINPNVKNAPTEELEKHALMELINEKVKDSIAKKNGIRIPDSQVEATKERILKKQNPFKDFVYGEEVYDDYLKNQIAWMQVVQGQIAPTVNIADDDLNDYITTLKKERGTPSTLVLSQLILPDEDKAMSVFESVKDIKSCKKFNEQVAFYGEPGSGDMGGKIDSNQLAPPLQQLFNTAPLNTALKPMPIGAGYIIFMVCSRKGQNFFNKPEIKERIQISLLNQKVEMMAEKFLADERRKMFITVKPKKYKDVMNEVY